MPSEATADIATLSFLIIEDDKFTRVTLRKTLMAMGASDISTADDGLDALVHLIDSTSPDVMLLDINMPDMSGAKLLHHLAERNHQGAIIIVSGGAKDTITAAEGLANYRGLNVLGHIIKPMTPDSLAALLAKLQ